MPRDLPLFLAIALVSFTAQLVSQASTPTAPSDTAARVAEVAAFTRRSGTRSTIDKSVTDALSLTRDAETLTVLQIVATSADGVTHGFSQLEDGRFLLGRATMHPGEPLDPGDRAYLIGRDLTLVAAVIKRRGKAPVMMPADSAQRESHEEIRLWAAASEQLPTTKTAGEKRP